MAIGGAVFFALVLALLLWDQRRRRSRNERPPQQQKLLRPAGWSLLQRMDGLNDRLLIETVVGIGAAAVVALFSMPLGSLLHGWVVGRFTFAELRSTSGFPTVVSAALLVVAFLLLITRQGLALNRLFRQLRDYRFGLRGEQAVAEVLGSSPVVKAGYTAFHDVPGSGRWNIDHVVVGPGGVFVLETKTRVKRRSLNGLPEHQVDFDGQVLHYPWAQDERAAAQVQRNAEWVRQFLNGFAPKDVTIQPVLVIPGWFVQNRGNYPVKAMNPKYLASKYLPSTRREYTPEQLEPILRAFEERCRTLEF